ncbi:MAG: HNH nuclease family protein [Chloroflexi bacterium]|nr:HNH nuclease family protein [Chloroflexota bacterium]
MNTRSDREKRERILADALRDHQERQNTYRERALKLFPKICARCGREFAGKRLRELTVHHKDHNHENNPPDGSNWELLCLYCHENEHLRYLSREDASQRGEQTPHTTYRPFADLGALLSKGENRPDDPDNRAEHEQRGTTD